LSKTTLDCVALQLARKTHGAAPSETFREALTSRYRRFKIEGGAFFYTLALADRGSDLLVHFGE
jgi:hypothetical protein